MKRELYPFIRPGARVRWIDPAIGDYDPEDHPGQLETVYTVVSVGGDTSPRACCEEDDDIVLISTDHGEAEVWPTELTLVTPAPEEIGSEVRHTSPWLLSCLKWADLRRRRAEAEADRLRKQYEELARISKKDRQHYVLDKKYKEMRETLADLERKCHLLRSENAFLAAFYYSHGHQEAVNLTGPAVPFSNSACHLGRALGLVPEGNAPVYVEDSEGNAAPVVGCRFDPQTGTVRIAAGEPDGKPKRPLPGLLRLLPSLPKKHPLAKGGASIY